MFDLDLNQVEHHPAITEIVQVLCNKIQNPDTGFFKAQVAYFLCKMASSMRATINTKDRGVIPVSLYVLALATSGFGKGHSLGIVEDEFTAGFKTRFMEDTFFVIAEQNLWKIANKRAARNGTDQQEEFDKAEKEFRQAGPFTFTFDSGTPPAVKQMRQKLLMADIGSISYQVDEVGSNLTGSVDVLNLFLELFDKGRVKTKLVKNTVDNQRGEELDGMTPTNMLLFGTPSKLLDGGNTEDLFYAFLDVGYARRCLYGFGQEVSTDTEMTAEELFARLTDENNIQIIQKWSTHFTSLADPSIWNWQMDLPEAESIQLLSYRMHCDRRAAKLPEHEEIKKAEIKHRYFKVLKLAGAFAFIDQSNLVMMDHINSAIKLVEESGESFQQILNREKSYVKLARFIANCQREVTHTDLMEQLPFYKSGTAARNEMMTLAIAWGYKKHIVIKKMFVDGIEFFRGETLKETNLDEIVLSYADHWAYGFLAEKVPFDQLHVLTQSPGMHWSNHHFKGEHRAEENVLEGFNTIVLDVDEGITLATVHKLLKDYRFMTYTTKRHQTEGHGDRFRIILPMNYYLELDEKDYKEFMDAVMAFMPFHSDDSANQRSKKWESFEGGHYHYNDGKQLFDCLPFIPKTSRNEAHQQEYKKLESLDNLERWFAARMVDGNRNNHMIRFALALLDGGVPVDQIKEAVFNFNEKLSNPLDKSELENTVLRTVQRRASMSAAA
jgi:hypothetical protein